MTLSVPRCRHYLKEFQFQKLFIEEMGWDRHNATLPVEIDGQSFTLKALVKKRGVLILECPPVPDGSIPERSIRQKIEKKIAKATYEHLIIFVDDAKTRQVWQWVSRRPGQPAAYREHSYHADHQTGDALIQKLGSITFSLGDEEGLTLTGVAFGLRDAFDRDRVTKRFYDVFKKEHRDFLDFIDGITEQGDRDWYASLMLNRLMFIYFIQRKGFLDGDTDYLKNRLQMVRKQQGKDKFLTFYRYFLLRLFHEGFGQQPAQRAADLDALLGRVPYLNGGLFDVHELEQKHTNIDIPDKAFERLFAFFDQYEWHLDTRPLQNDREINPDVLGYIFEKYINQKQMGAYYTKEDITEYISKNTIVPNLFDAAKEKCAIAFQAGSAVWNFLRNEPDRYIYPAMRKGVIDESGEFIPLPDEIEKGVNDVSQRGNWNTPAAPEYALPTEIWREHVARRQRCLEIREKLADGKVNEINDLITYNLDIRQFAEDVISSCEGPELIRAFYQAVSSVTVLDPTCGSGAFLFAALNILESLYEACLDRMQAFVEDLERSGETHRPEKFRDFKKTLAEIDRHPNRRYFILKSIVVNNLYGVDIMEEAVEICKLRLFLKLVAQVDKVGQLEPLPDIDFNIRAGNTLVGFVSVEEIRKAATYGSSGQITLISVLPNEAIDRIEEDAEVVDRAFKKFHEMQTSYDMDAADFAEAKQELRERLRKLDNELDRYLAKEYQIDPDDANAFAEWQKSHQPFHWFVEFYGIMSKGGFDVIIGNPPYLYLTREIADGFKGYKTLVTKNLYSLILERCQQLIPAESWQGYIVPVSSISTEGYIELQKILAKRMQYLSSFDDRPAHLFDGLDKNTLSIIILTNTIGTSTAYSTRLSRWNAQERGQLFFLLQYNNTPELTLNGCIPKIGSLAEENIWNKVFATKKKLSKSYINGSQLKIFYSRKINAFLQILDFVPSVYDGSGELRPPSEFKELNFESANEAKTAFCFFNSTLFRWFMDVVSDGSHVNKREINNFCFNPRQLCENYPEILEITTRLSNSLNTNSITRTMRYKHDTLTVQCIIPKDSKNIIDEIDCVLAKHYGFTDEELDFIINYDIKYRMGIN